VSENKKISTNGIMWTVGIALTLLIWALQLLGVVDSVALGCVLLAVALLLLVIPFWRWETALTVPKGFRALIIIMFVVIYCGASGAIVWRKYSNHPKEVVASNPTPSQPTNLPDTSKLRPDNSQPPSSSTSTPRPNKPDTSSQPPSTLPTKKKDGVKAADKPSAHPTVPLPTQNCPNGICIGGDNYGNPQVFNTPQPISFTSDQLTK
jgi:hypothetical protein